MKSIPTLFGGLVLGLAAPLAQAITCQNGIAASNPDSAYTESGGAGARTVTDTRSGLMWDKCAWGQSGDDCSGGAASTPAWDAALAVAATANGQSWKGHADWRLPNIKELESLSEECRAGPAINDTLFPNTPSWYFWSGSPVAGYSYYAWYVVFDYGYAYDDFRGYYYHVRLVRGGQSFDSFDAADTTAPILSAVGVSGTIQTATTLSATSNEAATGTWIVVARNATAPTSAQVKAGVTYSGVAIVASGSGAMSAALAQTFSVTGLTAGTSYDLYVAAEDGSANLVAATSLVAFATTAAPDTTPPVVSAVGFSGTTQTTTTLSATSNEAGSGYWIVVARNAAAPTSAQVKAAASYSGVAIVASGSGAMSAALAQTFAVTGLAAGTNYDVYVVAEDGSANLSTPPVKAQLATLFAPVTSYTGTPPGVAGSVTASFTGGGAACGYTSGQFVAGSSLPSAPPGGIAFPQGLFQFAIGNCTPGSTLSFTITYAQPLPANAQYWKYGKTPGNGTPHWYTLTVADNALNIGGSTVTFNITDGGLGDDDIVQNGQISDPGGPGAPAGATNATSIPTLSEWGVMLLSGLMGIFGWVQMRRRNG